jgi:transcription elongation GreA/GreB family factor
MSRAFVKEEDDAPPPPPLERPVSSAPNFVTARGARLMDAEILRIEAALALETDDATAAELQRDLRYRTTRRATSRLVEAEPNPETVAFGTRVRIRRDGEEREIAIVGEDEADPEAGLVSWTSPLARALDAAEAGDEVELRAGSRVSRIEVLAVEPGGG